jgi:hypothetical protein
MIYFVALAIFLLILFLSRFPGFGKHLPVLMYHKVAQQDPDYLTVTVHQIEKHFQYLKKKDTPLFS